MQIIAARLSERVPIAYRCHNMVTKAHEFIPIAGWKMLEHKYAGVHSIYFTF